jgi:hypothetical protein
MTAAPARSFNRIAIAIVIAAVVIAAAIFAASSTSQTTTTLSPNPGGSSTISANPRLYEVIFRQMGSCSPTFFVGPWSVTLGSQGTIAEPSNAILPVQGTASSLNPNDTITFSVPEGTYPYSVGPAVYFQPSSGVVSVFGSDVTVILDGPVTSCTL